MNDIIDNFNEEYRFLSNFYPSNIIYEGLTYPTIEHAFQACKTESFYERKMISKASTPGLAKMQGRKVHLRSNWELIKDKIMEELLRQKFNDPTLKQLLLNTKNAKLIEGNYWHDNYWGNCYCYKCEDFIGKNKLGKLLMKIREEIQANESN